MLNKSLLATAIAIGLSASPVVNAALPTNSTVEQKVEIKQNVEKTSLEERVNMLELGIVGTTPEETVATFAKAVKTRNGAMQYALYTEASRVGLKKALENSHWVTGVSSPWVETYQIISQSQIQKDKMEFVVAFDLYTSFGYSGEDQAQLTLEKVNDKWYITNVAPVSEKSSIGIWKTYENIKDINIEETLNKTKTYNSSLGYQLLLSENVMNKLVIKDGTSNNEQGNPPSTDFYYKDKKQNKDVLIMTLLRLTPAQEKSSYYQEHPFLTKVGDGNKGSYYMVKPSEHPYGENENTVEGKEWAHLLDVLQERMNYMTPNN